MSEALHLLVVDDDADMRHMLNDALSSSGYDVHAVATGREMHLALERYPIALLILDLKLEREDGLTLARELRERSDIPIMMLTGKGTDVDLILSLELAADDFLMKPFNLRELQARIHALLRRARALQTPAKADEAKRNRIGFNGWVLDQDLRELLDPEGNRVDLTYAEYNLLEAFIRSPSRIWTREQLIEHSRGLDATVYDRTIDVLILRLRRKIEPNPRQPQFIRTERGVGYLFAAEVQPLD
ncbi:MAG: response regulator transcription factor [Saccharospirillum sp.]|nr:response regulator transcription factor [Saccharospirillum sp.]